MMTKTCLLMLLYLISTTASNAQLSPPGMGETKTAFWSAAGVKQRLDQDNVSITYIGMGRISGEADNPFNAASVFVLNQEFYHKLNPKWKYSMALSYRGQHEYDETPGIKEPAAINQEFRIYGRLQYTVGLGSAKWSTALRQEIRKFYTADFAQVPDGLQFRTRLKTQLAVALDEESINNLKGSAEALFAIAGDSDEGWGEMAYKESRFCFYYSLSPKNLPVTFDIGYMNNLSGHGAHISGASYLAMDIIIENPF